MKKNIFWLVMLIGALTSAVATPVQHQPDEKSLQYKINSVLAQFGDTVSIGILVKDPKSGKILYEKNAAHYFMPASNQKLLTAYAALSYLGENYTYQTKLFADPAKIQNGTLNDNIYLRFSGDPTFTLLQLDRLIHALSLAGIQNINGSIIIDDSAFDQMTMSPGTTWDDKDYCWGAPVSAIVVDDNCVQATLVPAGQPDLAAKVVLPSTPQSLTYLSNVVTHAPTAADKCSIKIKRSTDAAYNVDGCITTVPTRPVKLAMAIENPHANLQLLLTYLLTKNKITSAQQFEFRKIDTTVPLLASEYSLPVSELVRKMLKDSDNMIANTLFKTMGQLHSKDAGSFQNGSVAVRDILQKTLQLTIPDTTLTDGDGASRYDFLTPTQLVALLENAITFPHAASFVAALPVSGTDGTLKERMTASTVAGKVFAKTGSETAVNTLSGYLQTRKNQTLVFSIMINGFVDMPGRYQDLEDQICATLINNA
jgi:D-alanyl-D-alanine carboxypeptidase/D-alanyl-D-alanine-endopeptidase (penicillin-binding protein 4)